LQKGSYFQFLSLFHYSVYDVLSKDAINYNAKFGTIMANHFIKTVPLESALTKEQFKKIVENNINGKFKFAKNVTINTDPDDTITVHMQGCSIYGGNELLKSSGKQIFCPVCHMFRAIIQKGLGSKTNLTSIDKPGAHGECFLKYKMS